MKLGVFVAEGEMTPRGYGFAYRCYHRMGGMAYPMPLNLMIRWLRPLYVKLKNPLRNSDVDTLLAIEMYQRGVERGFVDAYRLGRLDALTDLRGDPRTPATDLRFISRSPVWADLVSKARSFHPELTRN